jgi:hypothetical protein
MIIEQAQILTTHNLAQLVDGLDLGAELRWPELARRGFEWICARLQLSIPDWHAEMHNVKNAAYAWRQMLFYLSLAQEEEVQRFLAWADEHLAGRREDFRDRFAPVMLGLHTIAGGGSFAADGVDRNGGRRLLGWTLERHWLLPERRPVARI